MSGVKSSVINLKEEEEEEEEEEEKKKTLTDNFPRVQNVYNLCERVTNFFGQSFKFGQWFVTL